MDVLILLKGSFIKLMIYNKYPLLNQINSPLDLDKIGNFEELCSEIRQKLIETIAHNGGHLSSNLGVVELTVALHKVFNSPFDKIVWDVGHQSYVHKMLTGRFDRIDTIRQEGGISGYTNRFESAYDSFIAGHSSTSISAALGLAESKKILNEPGHVVAVIGDGALTGGLAYEGLNNAGRFKKNFIIVLNDNKMSISKNVGAVARYLSAARIRPSYVKVKNVLEKVLNKNSIGIKLKHWMKCSKSAVKKLVYKNSIFEDMGFAYYGPVDGHNFNDLEKVMNIAKNLNKPVIVHVITNKGKGYRFAEKNPKIYHGVSSFDAVTGIDLLKPKKTFSSSFGDAICKFAENDPRICALTAAMTIGTELTEFKNRFKSRFFDVGIAEEHAVTFSGGLAAGGLIPVFAVYSSFLQRAYDEIIHDISLQKFKMVFAIDRAGLVGQDGETHQGVFDISFLSSIPDITIYAPSFLEEVEPMLGSALFISQNLAAIRYPRGSELNKPLEFNYTGNNYDFYGDINSETLIVSYGRIFSNAYFASKELESTCVLKLNVVYPIDMSAVEKSLNFKRIVFFEESILSGGIGEKFGSCLALKNYKGDYSIKAINGEFVPHATVESQLKRYGLDASGMINVLSHLTK